jgi:hypothetical protein
MSEGMPKYATQVVPVATAAALGGGPCRLMKVVVGNHTANTTVQFKNALTDTGTVILTISALANHSVDFDFTEVGGIAFTTGCFVKPAGANSVAYCWFE